MDEKALARELKKVFMQEAKERLNSIITTLIELDDKDNNDKKALIETVFRDMHSLKGAARSISLSHFESFFQILETFLSDIKKGTISLTKKSSELIQDCINQIDNILQENDLSSLDNKNEIVLIEKEFTEKIEALENNTEDENNEKKLELINTEKIKNKQPEKKQKLESLEDINGKEISFIKENQPEVARKNNTKPTITSTGNETVRITSGKLDSLLLKSENLIKIKQMFQENTNSIARIISMLEIIKSTYTKTQSDLIFLKQHLKNTKEDDRRATRRPIKNLIDFCDQVEANINKIDVSIRNLGNTAKENFRNSEKMVDNFLYEIKDVAMLPFSNILSVFPRMVKDISKDLKKEINFQLTGEENQIDRRILQEIKDPLIHLIRNSIDHGIETPEERIKTGKPEKGQIKLTISQSESNKIEIIIEDDGKGIDENAIRKKLLNEGLINDETISKLTKDDLIDQLFFSGFSTKEIITDISGRGLGLAIVKERLEKLGGKIDISSEYKLGTIFKLTLPVALSTFKGILLKVNERIFSIPSNNVEKVIRVKDPVIKKIENRESIVYQDTTYPLINLSLILALPEKITNKEDDRDLENVINAIIVEKNGKYMALAIDDILEEQEILVKDLGSQLKKVNNISGATILNSGEIVPILNIQDLFLTAQDINYYAVDRTKTEKTSEKKPGKKNNTILIAEDSITSRILLKNILESAGYSVETAVDGVAAMTVLRSKKIDLIVSDIEMPRMDGFTLTQKIKADSKLSEIPVILVTSLSSDEDKEKGIEAGANAYILKSQFDQSNLLGTIDSLI